MSGEDAYALTLDPSDFPDLDSIRTKWMEIQAKIDAFLERTTEDDMQRILVVESRDDFRLALPVWKVMLHIANHWMQHRTEIAMAVTELGCSPGDLDYIFYAMAEDAGVNSPPAGD